ncbi:periodic tryptophan protein [Anaeramoeba flamelloides]|uniref:Periodic tryptophan protein n=1 Tax=Anaeramoeba flamelloides TaxID=1746091 RepID=A0ABQ8Y0Y7_9EUKA|nr:periodic tryptophan protein [Anaeramoeba flamelloides]
MITALHWVPKGAASELPKQIELSEKEIEELNIKMSETVKQVNEIKKQNSGNTFQEESNETNKEKNNSNNKKQKKNKNKKEIPQELNDIDEEILKKFNLDNYDEEDPKGNLFTYLQNFEDLDYLKNPNQETEMGTGNSSQFDELIEEEMEENKIKPSDMILLSAKSDQTLSTLEEIVIEDESLNMYVHHDIILQNSPLCLAWCDLSLERAKNGDLLHDENKTGNLVAVGTFDPIIEIWDLDLADTSKPVCTLGLGVNEKEFDPQLQNLSPNAHDGAVLTLAWNAEYRNLMASGSDDNTVKIWDLTTTECLATIGNHTDAVGALAWKPDEGSLLLSGGHDSVCWLWDIRSMAEENKEKQRQKKIQLDGIKFKLSSPTECLKWDITNPNRFFISVENGDSFYYDIRKPEKPLFTVSCHRKETTQVAFSEIPGLFVTGGSDKFVKVWEISEKKISQVMKRNLDVGSVFALSFSPDNPLLLAVAGKKGEIATWDLTQDNKVFKWFEKKIKQYLESKIQENNNQNINKN